MGPLPTDRSSGIKDLKKGLIQPNSTIKNGPCALVPIMGSKKGIKWMYGQTESQMR